MPLFIENQIVVLSPPSVRHFHHSFSSFKESSQKLTTTEPVEVGPVGLLYIGQREYGGTCPEDDVIKIVGSEDATTCHIGVLRHSGSGAVCVLHFDGCGTQQGLAAMVQQVTEMAQGKPEGRLDLHLYGGFEDDRKNSEGVTLDLLKCLIDGEADIHLLTACIGEHNTTDKDGVPFPIIYGIGVEVATGRVFRATFPDKGPDMPLRSARHFTGSHDNIQIYNWKQRQMMIGPFTYEPFANVDMLLSLPDYIYRKHMSTSPAQEPASFEASIRACLQHLRDHPRPLDSIFKGGNPRCYAKYPDGKWNRV